MHYILFHQQERTGMFFVFPFWCLHLSFTCLLIWAKVTNIPESLSWQWIIAAVRADAQRENAWPTFQGFQSLEESDLWIIFQSPMENLKESAILFEKAEKHVCVKVRKYKLNNCSNSLSVLKIIGTWVPAEWGISGEKVLGPFVNNSEFWVFL